MQKRMIELVSRTAAWLVGAVVLTQLCSTVSAATVPFTEDFGTGSSNWRDSTGTVPLVWNTTGGPDGGAFAATTFNFAQSAANDTPVLFRGQSGFGSSGGAFVGDWVAGGVNGFDLYVRQNSGVPLNFFARFAGPANFPGAAKIFMIPVPSDTWTQLNTVLPDPSLVFEGPFTYPQVFSNIGNVQIGVSVPSGLAGLDQGFQFALDKVSIVPEPATLALLLSGGAVALTRRFRHKDRQI